MFSAGCMDLNLAENASLRPTKLFANVKGWKWGHESF